ncbi:MAG: hypothetical protein ACXVY8_07705 [Gaiellaceae bacterium]
MRRRGASSRSRPPGQPSILRALWVGIVLVAAGAAAMTGAASGAAQTAENYFGMTSKGMPLQLDIQGHVLTKHSFIDGQIWSTCPPSMPCTKKRWPSNVISLTPYRDIAFTGNRISYHRTDRGTDWWLEARKTEGGRVISGWVRQATHWAGYAPGDTGKVRFTTRLWASSEGVEWSGKTSDGKPLTMAIGYRTLLGDVPITVAQLSRELTCRDASGAAASYQVVVPKVEGKMSNLYFRGERKYQYPAHTRVPASGSVTTGDGVTVRAALTVAKLAPQAGGLVATGTLRLAAAGCDPLTTTFMLRPR